MRITYVAHARLPVQKAHGVGIMRSCEALARAGADVTLVVAHRTEAPEQDLFKAYGVEPIFRIRYLWLPHGEWMPFRLNACLFYLQAFALLPFIVRGSVLYTRDVPLALLTLLGIPVVYECHFIPEHAKSFYLLARYASRIVVTPPTLEACFIAEGIPSDHVLVAPSGVDLGTFSVDVPQAEARAKLAIAAGPLALYTGRFTTMGMDKGISDILRALVLVPELSFIAIGGHEDDRARYAEQAAALGVAERAHFLGAVSQAVLATYQRAADMLLMPFPDTPYYRSNMSPIKMFEYMASGRPIIASDLPTIRAVLTDENAVIVPPGNRRRLAEAMRTLLADPARAARLATRARSEAAQYSWEARSRRILAFLAPLARQRRAMKLLYASSISYPSPYANRLQILHTAQALGDALGEEFILGARAVVPSGLYTHRLANFHARRSPLLAWCHMRYIAREGITHVYSREQGLVFFIMLYNALIFRRPLVYAYEAHDIAHLGERRLAYVLRRSSHVFYTNSSVRRRFEEVFPQLPGSLLPNGVDLATFLIDEEQASARAALDLPLRAKLVVYTGRFTTFGNEKGIALVLEALALPALKDVSFVAVGGTEEDVRRYQALAQELGVAERALIRSATDQATLARYQRAADCLMMYFPNAFHYGEYMSPIKMFEYMASGRPIIASDLPSIREVLNEHNALLLPPDRAEVLAEGIAHLLAHPREGHRLAGKAREEVRSYAWDHRAEAIIAALTHLAV